MRKQYIIEVDESEIVECWNEQTVKELGYQEYALKQYPGIRVKPYNPSGDLISREALKETIELEEGIFWDSYSPNELVVRKKYIDNAPTVEPFEPDYVGAERVKARQRGYEEGYHFGMEMGKTLNPKIKQEERPQGDLISRSALKDSICSDGCYYLGSFIKEKIDNAPAIAINCKECDGYEAGYSAGLNDAERPQGEWICKDKVDGHMFGYSCSNCRNPEWQITRFCPNCGADMRKGDAEE